MQAKSQSERPVCMEHGMHIKLVCIDSHCATSPLVCSICLAEKKDYHKTPKGIVHALRELYPLLDKTAEIQRTSGELIDKIEKLLEAYFMSLRENMKIVIQKAQKDVLHRIRCNTAPSSLSKSEAQVMENLRHGAFDQILPKNLLEGADKIMSCEVNDNFPELINIRKQLQHLLENKFIQNCLKQITAFDILFKLLLKGNAFHSEKQPNRSPLLEYDSIMTAYYRLQGPLEWRNCGNCYFSVAMFKEEIPGNQKMYRDLATHQKRTVISIQHPGNGGCFNSDAGKEPIFKSASIIAEEIKEKLGLKDIWKDLLVIHGKPSGWAYNAEEGSMNAFGGPPGKGYSFCRAGEKAKKKIHLFVFN